MPRAKRIIGMATILVIDDVKGVRLSIVKLLSRQGHRVIEAADGEAGVEAAARHRPDLVVTDMLMPVQDGIDTIDRIRGQDPARAPKFLAMSGGGSLVPTEQALHLAERLADATIQKPFENADLLAKVDRLLAEMGR
jgi:CheY-like chemotaxis protein